MSVLALVTFMLAVDSAESTLTFDKAVELATQRASSMPSATLASDLAALQRSRLPNVRVEVSGNASRSLDFFSEGPFEVRHAASVLAFDYPLWDGGVANARRKAVEAKLRRAGESGRLDDARFVTLVELFGQLYLAQREQEAIRPLLDRMSEQSERSAVLLATGEISNLMATERREIALSFSARYAEIEARRIDAAARLRIFTGIESEPRIVLDLSPSDSPAGETLRDDYVEAMNLAVEESRARLRDVAASTGFRSTLSGYLGFGAADSTFRNVSSYGAFGVYGLRILFSYPLLRGANEISIAEVRADLQRTMVMRDAAVDASRARAAEYRLREEIARQRITFLRQSVGASREREIALERLISAGIRSESELAWALAERTRREVDLLAAEVERWKAAHLLDRMNAP